MRDCSRAAARTAQSFGLFEKVTKTDVLITGNLSRSAGPEQMAGFGGCLSRPERLLLGLVARSYLAAHLQRWSFLVATEPRSLYFWYRSGLVLGYIGNPWR